MSLWPALWACIYTVSGEGYCKHMIDESLSKQNRLGRLHAPVNRICMEGGEGRFQLYSNNPRIGQRWDEQFDWGTRAIHIRAAVDSSHATPVCNPEWRSSFT